MIFVGDIPATGDYPVPRHFKDAAFVVANLEGPIRSNEHAGGQTGLSNSPSVASYLKGLGVQVVTLANNHIFDGGHDLSQTMKLLSQSGISYCGAGEDIQAASKPAILSDSGIERVFLAFGWQPIECPPADAGRPGVNPLQTEHVIQSIKAVRETHPGATLTILPHWNYELEQYPMPMHRQLAQRAIDAGADAVIGSHSHCVQGVEIYKGAPIVYSIGNWFLAQGVFFGGKLTFPSFASLQLAFEWDPDGGDMMCHWFEYARLNHSLNWINSEPLLESATIQRLTPFAGMSHHQYIRWFKRNRRKKALLPVYADPDAAITNGLRDRWVRVRQALVSAAVALRLKGGPK